MTSLININNRLAATWLAAAGTGYTTAEQWRDWADRRIAASKVPPLWLIEMSLAKDLNELGQALFPLKEQEDESAGTTILIGSAKLGFHYLKYQRGDYTLREFLVKAGEEADGGTSDLDCEVVYQFLNGLDEMRDCDVVQIDELDQKLASLFQPYKDRAEAEWNAVQSVADA